MKSAAFEYVRATGLDQVCRQLADSGGEARIIAGGQSLVPLMAMRMARPALLIDINAVAELQGIEVLDDQVRIAACTRQRCLERHPAAGRALPLLAAALSQVGHIQTRNRGTVGGSLCQADPAAEIPLIAVLLDAVLHVRSARGARDLAAREFFLAAMETALADDECLVAVSFPRWNDARCGWAFHEVSTRQSDFAMVAVAVQLALDAAGRCGRVAVAAGGVAPVPVRLEAVAGALAGSRLADGEIEAAAALAGQEIAPEDDVQATAAYRRRVTPGLVARALRQARDRAQNGDGRA